jgi:tRNA dimethylallyltransferase
MAVARAASRPVHLVAVDAMQVYRGMDIGTAKPASSDRAEVVHHCLDLADPDERFTVARFVEAWRAARGDIDAAGAVAVAVAGTGLYLTALLDGLDLPGEWPDIRARLELEAREDPEATYRRLAELDPVAAARIEPGNLRRIVRALEVCLGSGRAFSSHGGGVGAYPPTTSHMFGIRWPRELLRVRIATRVDQMMDAGLFDEVRSLWSSPRGLSPTARQALGYKEMIDHLEGRCSLDEAVSAVVTRTCRFATRQERWFRRDPRIVWLDAESDPVSEAAPTILAALS